MYARMKQNEPCLQIATAIQLYKLTKSGAKMEERRNALRIMTWEPLGKPKFGRSGR
jgi:hypothetical protein